ncbi:hypothetical protein AKJ56_01325 [candidate division MSBL1 archaeon SCGC-AAA382N08]|uniref:Uncharacterized protein n=1 Tax=candidate division MSBL1 archaeon SCGC-AAA382N08 TaxID=1698285 RepID=A0A133VPR0_9EURY|nr:hypothetical protein AKJ56_01325 [candidate division MSBL1 archaeon SCGC-AAA382N08]
MNREYPKDWKQSQIKIFEVLEEEKHATFSELHKKTGLSKSTFSNNLKELENEGLIERKAVPPEGGKGRHKILIQFADHVLEPIERTLRHVVKLKSVNPPSLEEGKELLKKNVKEVIFDIATIRWSEPDDEEQSGDRELFYKIRDYWQKWLMKRENKPDILVDEVYEFNEYWLICGLARYYVERRLIPMIAANENVFPKETFKKTGEEQDCTIYFEMFRDLFSPDGQKYLFDEQEELAEFYKEELTSNNDLFPAMKEVEKAGVKENLDGLVEWIFPLLSSPHMRADTESGINLVSAVFQNERDEYIREVLNPAWREKMRK